MNAFGITYNDATESWEGVPKETTVTSQWTVLALDNGLRILSFGGKRKAGEDVHIIEGSGRCLGSWSHVEWRDEPETVMGAILRLSGGPIGFRRGIEIEEKSS
ncbi:MAG TPA: hypothetical protein EYQ31_09830 [Candidatus Handelsmanbacteria bacterium]|nr:hypothetical protein [Candidatus Handelsmanbacteria bacterium]